MGALYINAHKAIEIRQILEHMSHPQPPMPMQTNNSITKEKINSYIQPKWTKAMEMYFNWLKNREVNQKTISLLLASRHYELCPLFDQIPPTCPSPKYLIKVLGALQNSVGDTCTSS